MGEGGFEPPKPKQQIYSLPHLTALELSHMKFKWSWWTDLNPRPADYKSAALPTELHQRICFLFCPDDLFIIPHHFIFVKCFLKLFLKLINFFSSSCRRRACAPHWGIIGIIPSFRHRSGKLPLPCGESSVFFLRTAVAAASCRPPVGNHWCSFFAPPSQRQAAAPLWGIIGVLSSHRRRRL